MSADLNAIKARWAAAMRLGWPWDEDTISLGTSDEPKVQAIAHAPEDIAALIQALEEVRDALDSHEMRYEYRNAERDAVANIRTVLERRMGADWLNGRGDSE